MVDRSRRRQPRWPRATPWEPRGPGPGRWRDSGTGWIHGVIERLEPHHPPGSGRWTDADLDLRARQATEATKRLPSSRSIYRPGGPGTPWAPERAALHEQILTDFYARYAHIPARRQAVLAGGLAGAGKTTVLAKDGDVGMPINPDDMKEELAARGAIPSVAGWESLAPMERATLIHLESSHLADRLLIMALADGRDVVIDATMGDADAPRSRLRLLHESGYRARGVFVDVPVEVSVERAAARYRAGMRAWAAGRGWGGRPIPAEFIMRSAPDAPGGLTRNRKVFQQLVQEGVFDSWAIWDNSGSVPTPISRG